jgi:hypothetical protein
MISVRSLLSQRDMRVPFAHSAIRQLIIECFYSPAKVGYEPATRDRFASFPWEGLILIGLAVRFLQTTSSSAERILLDLPLLGLLSGRSLQKRGIQTVLLFGRPNEAKKHLGRVSS